MHDNVNVSELIDSLRLSADIMRRIDGDRDHMNTSRLSCEHTQNSFRLMLIAADKLEAVTTPDGL